MSRQNRDVDAKEMSQVWKCELVADLSRVTCRQKVNGILKEKCGQQRMGFRA